MICPLYQARGLYPGLKCSYSWCDPGLTAGRGEEGAAALHGEARGCRQCCLLRLLLHSVNPSLAAPMLGYGNKSSYASSPALGRLACCRCVMLLALPGLVFCSGGSAGELVPCGKSPEHMQLDCIF